MTIILINFGIMYSTENEEKSTCNTDTVMSWSHTIKNHLRKFFFARPQTSVYIGVLIDTVYRYNNYKHSSVKIIHVRASLPQDKFIVYRLLYEDIVHEENNKP